MLFFAGEYGKGATAVRENPVATTRQFLVKDGRIKLYGFDAEFSHVSVAGDNTLQRLGGNTNKGKK